MRERLGLLLAPGERDSYERARGRLEEALGEPAFSAAWAEGRALGSGEALRLALEAPAAVLV
jgi:hypothetical protein